jgi:hypothetical protein
MSSPKTPTRSQLRRFGLTVALGLTLVGGASWWRGHLAAPVILWSIALPLLASAIVLPTILAPVERAWLALGASLAWINTRIILTAVFYLVVTPISALMRFFVDPLDRRIRHDQPSYWIRRTPQPFDARRYHQQF